MRIHRFAIGLCACLFLVPNLTWSQGSRAPWGGGMPSPEGMFDRFSGGKDVIVVSEIDPQRQRFFKMIAETNGLTGDRITREQFQGAMGKKQSSMASGGFRPPTTETSAATTLATAALLTSPRLNTDFIDAGSERRFRDLDKNNDGLLSYEEMPEEIQRERDTWDTNKDGFIDLAEYKAFRTARVGRPVGSDPQPLLLETPHPTAQPEEVRPTVYRAGKLPKELPEWFARLDQQGDNDGQVGLYEWRNDKRPLSEFMAMDLNGDGYLTAEEYLQWKAKNGTKKGSAGEALVSDRPGTSAAPVFPATSGNFTAPASEGTTSKGFGGQRPAWGGGGRPSKR